MSGENLGGKPEAINSRDTQLLGARVLSSVNFEDSHKDIVQSSFERARNQGEKIEGNHPGVRRNYAYLDRILKLVEKYGSKAEQKLCRLSATKLIVKEDDIPAKFWERENRRSLERGDGELTDEAKERTIESVQERQRRSIEKWSSYLGSEESPFPLWFKSYVFDGISKMGRYDGSNEAFFVRRKGDTSSYPNLNEAALSQVYQAIVEENGDEPDVEKLANGGNFNRLYSKFYTEQSRKFENIEIPENPENVHGKWVEYGIDQIGELFNVTSLNGCWCIGQDYGVLEGYLGFGGYLGGNPGGQFNARESLDSSVDNKSKFILFHPTNSENDEVLGIPLASIRLDRSGGVAEISGVMDDECGTQILNDALVPEVKDKVLSLPGGEKYKKAFEQREKLISIRKRLASDENLEITGHDLEFLWMPEYDYASIGEYENIGASRALSEMRDKTREMFLNDRSYFRDGGQNIGSIKLAYVLQTYGLGKSIDLVPKIVENGVNLTFLANSIQWDYLCRDNGQQVKFANTLLENGLPIEDLYGAITREDNVKKRFDQLSLEGRLLGEGFSPEAILKSLNKNGKRAKESIVRYTEDGLGLEEVIPYIDMTDVRERWREVEYSGLPHEDAEIRKLFDETVITQLKEWHERVERYKNEHGHAWDEYELNYMLGGFISHLESENKTYGYLGHIDDVVEVCSKARDVNDLLRFGADPDVVINKLIELADKDNEELDDYVYFTTLLDAYKRRGKGPVMPDEVVKRLSSEFVARRADDLMSENFEASANAVAEKLNPLTVMDRIQSLYKRGADASVLANRAGEALVDTVDLIYGLAKDGASTQISVDALSDYVRENFADDGKADIKSLLQKIIDSIE